MSTKRRRTRTIDETKVAPAVRLTLLRPGCSLRSVLPVEAEEVRAWYKDRASFVLPREAELLLDPWAADLTRGRSASLPGWRPEGPGRTPAEAATTIEFLRQHAHNRTAFSFNALWLEPQGGRSYAFNIDGYRGPITISKNKYAEAAGSRRLLAALRRDVRGALLAESGWSLAELDFKSCHASIGLALSGDKQLAVDLAGDVHEIAGDFFFRGVSDADQRRGAGKALNNSMFFGLSAHGIKKLGRDLFGGDTSDAECTSAWNAWWQRYPGLMAFRDDVQKFVGEAQAACIGFEIAAPSGRVSRFSAAEISGTFAKPGRTPKGRDGVWRSVFSACFRAVEGDLLDGTLRNFYAASAGGKIAMPIFDGALFAAPAGAEGAVAEAMTKAAETAAINLGIAKITAVVKRR